MPVVIYNLRVEQGATLNSLVFVLDGNYTSWLPQGQIRSDYASRGGILKADFAFPPLVIGDVTLADGSVATGTIVRPTLTAEQTAAFEIPSKLNNWVYDIGLRNADGEVIRLVQGRVEVSPQVTV